MHEFDRPGLTDRLVELVQQINRQMQHHPEGEWEGLDLTIPQIKIPARLQPGSLRECSVSVQLGIALSA